MYLVEQNPLAPNVYQLQSQTSSSTTQRTTSLHFEDKATHHSHSLASARRVGAALPSPASNSSKRSGSDRFHWSKRIVFHVFILQTDSGHATTQLLTDIPPDEFILSRIKRPLHSVISEHVYTMLSYLPVATSLLECGRLYGHL